MPRHYQMPHFEDEAILIIKTDLPLHSRPLGCDAWRVAPFLGENEDFFWCWDVKTTTKLENNISKNKD